jgi:hypothetical protein
MINPQDRLTQYVVRNFDCWMSATDHVNIEYLVGCVNGKWILSDAKVVLAPHKLDAKINDLVATSEVRVGHVRTRLGSNKLQEFVANLQIGRLKILDFDYSFAKDSPLSMYSPSAHQLSEYSIPQLEVRVDQSGGLSCEFSALRSHFVVGVKAPPNRRRNGATRLSALWRHFIGGVMAPLDRRR